MTSVCIPKETLLRRRRRHHRIIAIIAILTILTHRDLPQVVDIATIIVGAIDDIQKKNDKR